MTKSKTRTTGTTPQPTRPPLNPLATGFHKATEPAAPCLFTAGYEFAAERIAAKLPRLVAVALLAADVQTTGRKLENVAAVLKMLVQHDAETLLHPEPPAAPAMPMLWPMD